MEPKWSLNWSKTHQNDIKLNQYGKKKKKKDNPLPKWTKNTPKPLVKIANKPMILKIIENFTVEGFSKFTIIVNYLGEKIVKELRRKDKE